MGCGIDHDMTLSRWTFSDGLNATDFLHAIEEASIGLTAMNYSALLEHAPHDSGLNIYDVTIDSATVGKLHDSKFANNSSNSSSRFFSVCVK
jgi:hypothetical protein